VGGVKAIADDPFDPAPARPVPRAVTAAPATSHGNLRRAGYRGTLDPVDVPASSEMRPTRA